MPTKALIGEETLQRAIEGASHRGKRHTRNLVIALAAAVLVLGGGLIWSLSNSQSEIAQEADAARKQAAVATEKASAAQASAAKAVQGDSEDWASVVERYERSVFLCVAQAPDGAIGIGTAFAIGEQGPLATNAHVVDMLKNGAVAFVVQNGSGDPFDIAGLERHADFNGQVASPDIGLIRLDLSTAAAGTRFTPWPLASADQAKNLKVGMHMGTLGFPGELGAEYLRHRAWLSGRMLGAQATFKDGWVGRVLTYDGKPGTPDSRQFIQHSASLSGGTSGSPMFLADGTVVAVNNGGLERMVLTQDPTTGSAVETVATDASEIGFAIRVDVLNAYRKGLGW